MGSGRAQDLGMHGRRVPAGGRVGMGSDGRSANARLVL